MKQGQTFALGVIMVAALWACGPGKSATTRAAPPSDAGHTDVDAGDSTQPNGDESLSDPLATDLDSVGDAFVAPTPTELTLGITRGAGANNPEFIVHVSVTDTNGSGVDGLAPMLLVAGQEQGPMVAETAGHYRKSVLPMVHSGELLVRVSVAGLQAETTILVLPLIADEWDQPEPVPGLVNTDGTEDSAEVSPDGEWLLVGTYTPVDLLCCLGALPGICDGTPLDPSGAACNTSLGPVAEPARPRMPGASRVLSATQILDQCPSLGLLPASGEGDYAVALPPVAAYGFHRQSDGSFAEPFVIAFEMDGYTSAPFGFSFVTPPAQGQARVLFAFGRPGDDPESGNDLYSVDLALGTDNHLGRFSYASGSGITVAEFLPQLLSVAEPLKNAGNPAYGLGRLWYDTEAEPQLDLHVASWDGTSSAATDDTRVGLSRTDAGDFQPFVDGNALYWNRDNTGIYRSTRVQERVDRLVDWRPPAVMLKTDGSLDTVGAVTSIGEPSVAHVGNETWLYFVYYTRTPTGLNGNVGRVRQRAVTPPKVSITVLQVGDAITAQGTYAYQLLKLEQDGRAPTYAQWLPPPSGGVAPAMLLTQPYDGIDWTGEAVDALWAARGPGLHPDDSEPHFTTGSSSISYVPMSPEVAATRASYFLMHGFGVLLDFGRFYAGGDIANDRDDPAMAVAVLAQFSGLVEATKVGMFGGSWGGFQALYGAAGATDVLVPAVGLALTPLSDFADQVRWAVTEAPARMSNEARLDYSDAFFEPYLRRVYASTGGPPDAGTTDYDDWTGSALVSRMQTPFLLVHDEWDALVPYRQSTALVAAAPELFQGMWALHDSAPDWNTVAFDHGDALNTGLLGFYYTFGYAYLMGALAAPGQTIVIFYDPNTLISYVANVHARQLAGADVAWLAPRLADLADPRIAALDVTNTYPTFSGAAVVAYLVNTTWGTSFADSEIRAELLANGLPPP